jgi:hypothetical protein
MTGRPSDYTPEIADTICERVVMRPLHQVAKDDDMPSETAIYSWLGKHPDFATKYARAKEIRAHRRAEQVDQIMEDLKAGRVDHQQARVMLDAIKWQTGKEAPRVFGDKVQHEGTGAGGAILIQAVTNVPQADDGDSPAG